MRRIRSGPLACTIFLLLSVIHGCGDDGTAPPDDPACGIALTHPASGTRHLAGDDVSLRWDASGGGDVRISLLLGGTERGEIAPVTANDGYFGWTASTMGGPPGDGYAVAVVRLADAACADTLPGLEILDPDQCAIVPSVREAEITAGEDLHIAWTGTNTGGLVDIDLWYGPLEGVRLGQIAAQTPDDGEFTWEGAHSFGRGTGDEFFVRVDDSAMPACIGLPARTFAMVDEDVCSIIVPTPGLNSVHFEGLGMRIEFTALGTRGEVDLFLVAAPGNPVAVIADHVPAGQAVVEWTVDVDDAYTGPNIGYRVLVRDSLDHDCRGYSGTFSIVRDP